MIYDSLSNLDRYKNIKYINEIQRFIENNNVLNIDDLNNNSLNELDSMVKNII